MRVLQALHCKFLRVLTKMNPVLQNRSVFYHLKIYVGIESCIFVNADGNVEVKICINVEY